MQQRIEVIAKRTQGCTIDSQRIFQFFQQFIKQQKGFNDFEYLGNGAFALVIKAFNKNSQKQVALKIVLCNQNEPSEAEYALKEYNLLLKVKHCPYLVDVYNQFYIYEEKIILEDPDDEEQKGDKPKKENEKLKSFLVLELEYCSTNLADYFRYCRSQNQYPDKKMKEILTIQILDGISFLHQKQFLHRDIKPNNILLQFDKENNPIIKIYKNSDIYKEKKGIIQNIMINFPIFEMVQIAKQKPYQFEMEISTYNNSKQHSKISYDNDGNQKFEVNQQTNCVSYVKIKQDCMYKLIIKLDLKNDKNKHFFIGLVGQSHKDNKYINNSSYINSFTPGSIHSDRGVSKIVLGKCLRDVKYPDEYNQIEITFCVKNKFFQVSNYPNKKNINEINDDKLNLIDTDQQYFLGFELYFQNNSITILQFDKLQICN